MRVSELLEMLRDSDPGAEVFVCYKIPDGEGDYLLFDESAATFAEPYPGDGGRFLVHATSTTGDIASHAADPSVLRALAEALAREADSAER